MRKLSSITIALCLPFVAIIAACSSPVPAPTQSEDQAVTTSTPTQEPTEESSPTLEPEVLTSGDTRVSDVDGMEQIYIGEGEFTMGADDEDAKDTNANVNGVASPENPVQTIYVPSFWIDKHEVSNYQYSLCVKAGICLEPKLGTGTYVGNPVDDLFYDYYINSTYANYPVVYIDFYMARDYCLWSGRRLPNEREWEKAARGTDGRKYAWGDDPVSNDKGNFCDGNCPKAHANHNYDDGYAQTAPVGSYPDSASAYGALDMAGNVWEWVNTIPMNYPYDPEDGREEPDTRSGSCYPPNPCENDQVPFGGGPQRVWRGGTWSNGPWWMRVTVRYHSVPGYYHNSLGFRCAADAE